MRKLGHKRKGHKDHMPTKSTTASVTRLDVEENRAPLDAISFQAYLPLQGNGANKDVDLVPLLLETLALVTLLLASLTWVLVTNGTCLPHDPGHCDPDPCCLDW